MVGAAILIVLVGIFVSPAAILYAYVFPLIYSFIAPKIVKDKWLNKGYVALDDDEKIKFDLDRYLVSNESNSAISQKTIEAIELAVKINNYSSGKYLNHSSRDYIYLINNGQFILYRNYWQSIIMSKLLKVELENDLKISKTYYNHLSEADMVNMNRLSKSY